VKEVLDKEVHRMLKRAVKDDDWHKVACCIDYFGAEKPKQIGSRMGE